MSKILIYNTIDDFFEDIDSPLNKIERIKNNENNFLGLIDPENRLK